ncbi:uncharacterized protein BDV14DRAFT_203928 [Aspergillus stella-maris]|uniref:uncharacterized protein n=1 Tax=Aspergillus stella-maris TaxID=1810926 RepID=UPI003CCDA966
MTPWVSYKGSSCPTSNKLTPAPVITSSFSGYSNAVSSAAPPDMTVLLAASHNAQALSPSVPSHGSEPPRAEAQIKLEEPDSEGDDRLDMIRQQRHSVEIIEANEAGRDNEQPRTAISSRSKTVTLSSLDVESASDSKVLFYFGVLATKALLLPTFEYTSGRKSRLWGVKMKIYGMTFVRSHVYDSRKVARVCICREALKKLKTEFPHWIVPERPKDALAPPGWNWVETLREYCVHQGLSEPRYTKYVHHKGYRHEVEVDGDAYFGSLKHYSEEAQSKQGAAHVALYDVLVRGSELEGPSSLKRHNEAMLAVVPRDPLSTHVDKSGYNRLKDTHRDMMAAPSRNTACISTVPAKRGSEDYNDSGRSRGRSGRSKPPATVPQTHKSTPGNANLQPLQNCRLPVVETTVIREERRWEVTPSQITDRTRELKTWTAKLERVMTSLHLEICDLLLLEQPEIRIERTDGRLVENDGEYNAAAYFKSDPFLTRAGAIGQIKTFSGSKSAVREACAWAVCDYLVGMVREDMRIEDKAAQEREAINRWPANH